MSITIEGTCQEFEYTGSIEKFIPPYNGLYKLEVYGAQGSSGGGTGGAGGYSSGYLVLNRKNELYICVGGQTNYNGGGTGSSSGGNGGGTVNTPYKSTDTSIANYINGQLGKNVIEYDSTNKQYGLAYSLDNGNTNLNSQQVYSWYKDPIIQKVLIGVNDGDLSPNEAQQFLLNLGYSNSDIQRVKDYTFEKEGE